MMVELVGGDHDGQAIAVPTVPGRPPPPVLYATTASADVKIIGNTRVNPDQQLVYRLRQPDPGQPPRYDYQPPGQAKRMVT
jgi:hypothetical protein